MNISGISGVATKTSYALFLLYSLFNSGALGLEAPNTRALVFNVKGEDLLWLDKPNRELTDADRGVYQAANLPVGPFRSVDIWSPARREGQLLLPSADSRMDGVTAYAWSLEEFCRDRLLRFLFAEADSDTSQLSYLIRSAEEWLHQQVTSSGPSLAERLDPAAPTPIDDRGFLFIGGRTVRDFRDLVDVMSDGDNLAQYSRNAAQGTQSAFLRRLDDAAFTAGHLVRAIPRKEVAAHRIAGIEAEGEHNKQVTVIDIHNLHDRAKRFVVGVVVRRLLEQKEASGRSRPLVFLVLDELNKYAPREGWSPIK
jgi:DNA helicase HerA-like ATPase